MENLTQKEMEAIKKALEELGYSEIAKNTDDMARWYDDGTISINTARNGRAVAWVLLESCEKALYVDTLEELSEEEISDQLC